MTRLGGIATTACLSGLVLLAGCGAPPPDGPAATTAVAGTSPANTAASQPTSVVDIARKSEAEAVAAWEDALAHLEQADTVVYADEKRTKLTEEDYSVTTRTFEVDTVAGRMRTTLETRSHWQGETTGGTATMITTATDLYVREDGWTGAKKGKWIHHTQSSLEEMGSPIVLGPADTVPRGLEAFEPVAFTVEGKTRRIEGLVPAAAALELLGFAGSLGDEAFRASVAGDVDGAVLLDERGALVGVEVSGAGHRITGQNMPPELYHGLNGARRALTFEGIDVPMTIALPADGLLMDP